MVIIVSALARLQTGVHQFLGFAIPRFLRSLFLSSFSPIDSIR